MSSLIELLDDVEGQKEDGKLIIDFDSIIFLAAYKYKDEDNEELVYMDCCKRIYSIEREMWFKYELRDTKIAMTSSTNFRYDLYPEYKQNRKKKDEKAEHLSQLVKRTKRLIYERLKPILICNSIAEADDICIDLSKKGWIVAAMDSDVVGQSRSPLFNFHSKHWKFVHEGQSEDEAFINTLIDSIKGKSKDNVKGVKGIGEVKAKEFVQSMKDGHKGFSDWADLYPTPKDALLNFQLCDCSQVEVDTLNLIDMNGIADRMTNAFARF